MCLFRISLCFYGNVTTGIEIREFRVVEPEENPNQYIFLFDMGKTGNAPYRGSVDIVIRDEAGEVVEEMNRQVGLFTDRKVGITMERERVVPGREYVAEFIFRTQRSTSAPDDLVQSPDVTWSSPFTLSERSF